MAAWLYLLCLVFLLAASLAVCGLRHVPAGTALTVHRRGRHHRSLGPGWHWLLPGMERTGHAVELTGHHLRVPGDGAAAELYVQVLEPGKAGAVLDELDAWLAAQAREALGAGALSTDALRRELDRRFVGLGLRAVRCALHAG